MADTDETIAENPAIVETGKLPGSINPGTGEQPGTVDPVGQLAAAAGASGRVVNEVVVESAGGKRPGRRPKIFPPAGSAPEKTVQKDNLPCGDKSGVQTVTPVVAVFDKEIFEPLIGAFVEMSNDIAVNVQESAIRKITGDKQFAHDAGQRAAMSPKTRELLNKSLLALTRKYADKMEYAPEIACVVGFGLWTGSNYLQLQTIAREYKKPKLAEQPPKS